MTSDIGMPADWTVTRRAIETAYSALGEPVPNDIPERDWRLVGLALEADRIASIRTCVECRKPIEHGVQIVCLDCHAALHEACAPRHFWPNGRPPRDLEERARSYADSLDAHLDEGGKYTTNNVLDLITFIRTLTASVTKGAGHGE